MIALRFLMSFANKVIELRDRAAASPYLFK